jgi:hypothetical protein
MLSICTVAHCSTDRTTAVWQHTRCMLSIFTFCKVKSPNHRCPSARITVAHVRLHSFLKSALQTGQPDAPTLLPVKELQVRIERAPELAQTFGAEQRSLLSFTRTERRFFVFQPEALSLNRLSYCGSRRLMVESWIGKDWEGGGCSLAYIRKRL